MLKGAHARDAHTCAHVRGGCARQAEASVSGGGGAPVRVLGGSPAWDPGAVKAFIGVSGAYDVFALADHLDRRGLYKTMFGRIMAVDGAPAFKALSPLYAFQNGQPELWCRPTPHLPAHRYD